MPKRAREKHRKKTTKKSILASVLASQNPPKIDPTSKKIEQYRFRKKEALGITPQTPQITREILWGPPPDDPTIIPLISTSPSIHAFAFSSSLSEFSPTWSKIRVIHAVLKIHQQLIQNPILREFALHYERHPESMRTVPWLRAAGGDSVPLDPRDPRNEFQIASLTSGNRAEKSSCFVPDWQ